LYFFNGNDSVVTKRVTAQLDDLSQGQRERLSFVEFKAYFCADLSRADIERRFGVKPAATARDLATYRRLAPQNLIYDPAQRRYATTDHFSPLFEHTAERVLTWFRSGFGDGLDIKLRRSVPCETASDLVKPDLETLAVLTRAITNKRQVKVSYLSVASGASTKTLSPLALADTGLRWHLRAYDCERERFADFSLTRIVKAKNLNKAIPEAEKIESDAQWARIVRLEMVPHPGLKHPKAVEADFRMEKGMFSIDMRAPLVGYALRRWSVDCTTDHSLDCKEHHLWLCNHQTLYGVESAELAPGYKKTKGQA
jgi:hypothetical protein